MLTRRMFREGASVWHEQETCLCDVCSKNVISFGCHLSFLALTGLAGGCASVAPGPGHGCVGGVRRGPLHADSGHPCEDSLQTSEERTPVQGTRRWGGDSTEPTQELEIEEVDHSGGWIRRPDAADAHAGERCSKRIRTAAP